jgi:hypothetical protein
LRGNLFKLNWTFCVLRSSLLESKTESIPPTSILGKLMKLYKLE